MLYDKKCKFCGNNFQETDNTCNVYITPEDKQQRYIKVHEQCCNDAKAGKIALKEIDFSDVPTQK